MYDPQEWDGAVEALRRAPTTVMAHVRNRLAWERELELGPEPSAGADICRFRTHHRTYSVNFTDRIVRAEQGTTANGRVLKPLWWAIPQEAGKVPTVVLGRLYEFTFVDSSGEHCHMATGTVVEFLD